jgi:hypothetical protein
MKRICLKKIEGHLEFPQVARVCLMRIFFATEIWTTGLQLAIMNKEQTTQQESP